MSDTSGVPPPPTEFYDKLKIKDGDSKDLQAFKLNTSASVTNQYTSVCLGSVTAVSPRNLEMPT